MQRRKIAWTALAVLAAGAALSGIVDSGAEDYAEKAFKRALLTFGIARTLNGVISVAQGTEVAIEPAGIGVNLTVGQILDPINDLVERFSAVLLVATSSLGLQIILLDITAWWGVTIVLVITAGLMIASIWSSRPLARKYSAAVLRVVLIMLFIRFAVPLLIIGTNLVSDTFLAARQAESTAVLEATRVEIEELNDQAEVPPDPDASLMERLESVIDESLASINVSDRISRLKDSASNASEHIVNLIVVFVLQTIILPLLFLWLLSEGLKGIAKRSARLSLGSS